MNKALLIGKHKEQSHNYDYFEFSTKPIARNDKWSNYKKMPKQGTRVKKRWREMGLKQSHNHGTTSYAAEQTKRKLLLL